MNVVEQFERYNEENKLFTKVDKILVAVSGGRDSMLLLWLLVQAKYQVEVAHCNFQLRGEESDGDEKLVRDFANDNNIPLHVSRFETTDFAEANKISIQMAARELRYTWFEELRIALGCSVIAVAQHMNDSVETVLFNLSRGTGLQGLQGILPKRLDSKVVRPILFLKSKEVTELVQKHQIPYRDDSSNASNKYARNKIRLDIIPEFEELNPDFVSNMNENIARFRDTQEVLREFVNQQRNQLFSARNTHSWTIRKNEIRHLSINQLYFLLEPYGFSKNVLVDLVSNLDRESGKQFHSERYVIIIDRDSIILSAEMENAESVDFDLNSTSIHWGNVKLDIETDNDFHIMRENNIAQIDFHKVIFPLRIRSWCEGDAFHPLGMKGTRKLSDYFIQKKINILDKKQVPILVNGDGQIIWIVNYHLDDRFKMTENTQKVLKLVSNLTAI